MLKNAKVIHKPLSATNKKDELSMENAKEAAEQKPLHGFMHQSEEEKMWQEFNRPFINKLQSFTRMIRRNKMLAEVTVHPKK